MTEVALKPDVIEAIRVIRNRLGISGAEMAKMLGFHWSTCNKWERSDRPISLHALDRFREKIGFDLYLFAWCMNQPIDGSPEGSLASLLYGRMLRQLDQLNRS